MNVVEIGFVERAREVARTWIEVVVKKISAIAIGCSSFRVYPDVVLQVRILQVDAIVNDCDHDVAFAAGRNVPRIECAHVLTR